MSSVTGAILAREIAVRRRHPAPEDDLAAALLSNLGEILLRRTFPDAWEGVAEQRAHCLPERICQLERETFGIDHADAAAELLKRWQLPDDLVEPIRRHHEPELLVSSSRSSGRAELLFFVECLTHIDRIARQPDRLSVLLSQARERYGLPRAALLKLLEDVAPKVSEFANLLNVDVGASHEFGRALQAGSEAMAGLALEAGRTARSQNAAVIQCTTGPDPGKTHLVAELRLASPSTELAAPIPEFTEAFIASIPAKGCRLGGYELRELIGRGAMGIVFKAYEPSLDRFVAVKVLAPEVATNPTARQRFAREARLAASIQHENVVAIYVVREAGRTAYLAMECVEGSSLKESLARLGPPPAAQVVLIAAQVAAGLAAAHARGIVHRDVKPANMLVESRTGRVKITDFGLARSEFDRRLSREGALIGTPLFMAPEQILGGPVDLRTDLFAFGGMLYTLCTGQPPFPADHLTDVLRHVCEREPIPPRQLRKQIPDYLEAIVLRLLRKKPEERFQSAEEVVRAPAGRGG